MHTDMRAYTTTAVQLNPLSANDVHFKSFQALPIAQNMSEAEAALIFSAFRLKTYQAGEFVYRAGSASAGEVYIILNGKVNVSNESGHQYASLRTGDVFGLFSFLDGQRNHSACIQVERDIEVLTLERTLLNTVDSEQPKLGRQLMRFMFDLLSHKALSMEIEYAHMHSFAFGSALGKL